MLVVQENLSATIFGYCKFRTDVVQVDLKNITDVRTLNILGSNLCIKDQETCNVLC